MYLLPRICICICIAICFSLLFFCQHSSEIFLACELFEHYWVNFWISAAHTSFFLFCFCFMLSNLLLCSPLLLFMLYARISLAKRVFFTTRSLSVRLSVCVSFSCCSLRISFLKCKQLCQKPPPHKTQWETDTQIQIQILRYSDTQICGYRYTHSHISYNFGIWMKQEEPQIWP